MLVGKRMKDDRYRVFAHWKHSLKAHAVAINKFYIQNLLVEYYVRYDGYGLGIRQLQAAKQDERFSLCDGTTEQE